MPNKNVPSWVQVPVAANDILEVNHSRPSSGATITVYIQYIIRDDQGVDRGKKSTTTTSPTYPLSGANALSACNTAEGT